MTDGDQQPLRALLGSVIAVHDRVLTIQLQAGARLAFLFFCSRTEVILVVLYYALTAIRDCTPSTVDVAHCIIDVFLGRLAPPPSISQNRDRLAVGVFQRRTADAATLYWPVEVAAYGRSLSAPHLPWSNPSTAPATSRRQAHHRATKTLTPEEAADRAFDLRGLEW